MTRVVRRPRPELSESWDTVGDGGDFIQEDTVGTDGEEGEYEPLAGSFPNTVQLQDDGTTPLQTYQTRASAKSTKSARLAAGLQRDGTAAASPRRTTRASSRMSSAEPEFIMPSLHQDAVRSSPSRSTPRSSAQISKRQSRSSTDVEFIAKPPQQAPRSSRAPKSQSPTPDPRTHESVDLLHLIWAHLLSPALSFGFSVLGSALHWLRPVLGILMAIWLGRLFLGHYLTSFNGVSTLLHAIPSLPSLPSLQSLPSPCSLPGSSYLPFCPSSPPDDTGTPLEFDALMTVQSAFSDVLSASVAGATLPLDMKRSEASIRDLKHVVRYSHLPSRNELVFEFGGFIDTARQASADLTRFNSRIGRAVDHILSTNRWTLHVMDDVASAEAGKGALGRLVESSGLLAPLFRPARLAEDVLLEQYLKHTRAVEEQIAALIVEAQALLSILTNLDDRLDVIAAIVARDGVALAGTRDELFADLWTRLGGNRASVARLEGQLRLLREVGVYRRTAWAHVSATVLKLQSIAAGLEDLRERVGAAEVGALEVPLRQHVENIQMGVERLERQREESRRVEGEGYRRVLDRGGVMGEERMVGDGVRSVEVKLG